MNKGLYLMFYVICFLAGLAGFVADTYLNLEFVGFNNTGPAITIVVITVCSAIALSATTVALKFKKYFLAVICFVGLLSSFFWHVPVTLSRIASTMDHKSIVRDNHEVKKKTLERAYEETKKARVKESEKGGCKDNCQKLMAKEEALLKEIGEHGTTKTEDAAARRISYMFPSISAETVEMVVPMFAVVSLTCLMNGLLALGLFGLLDRKYKDDRHFVTADKVLDMDNLKITSREQVNFIPTIKYVRGDDNDPFIKIIKANERLSISSIAQKTGKTLSYASAYISDLEKRGKVIKIKEGRKTYIELKKH